MNPKKLDKCEHGISKDSCSLCLGMEQTNFPYQSIEIGSVDINNEEPCEADKDPSFGTTIKETIETIKEW